MKMEQGKTFAASMCDLEKHEIEAIKQDSRLMTYNDTHVIFHDMLSDEMETKYPDLNCYVSPIDDFDFLMNNVIETGNGYYNEIEIEVCGTKLEINTGAIVAGVEDRLFEQEFNTNDITEQINKLVKSVIDVELSLLIAGMVNELYSKGYNLIEDIIEDELNNEAIKAMARN